MLERVVEGDFEVEGSEPPRNRLRHRRVNGIFVPHHVGPSTAIHQVESRLQAKRAGDGGVGGEARRPTMLDGMDETDG